MILIPDESPPGYPSKIEPNCLLKRPSTGGSLIALSRLSHRNDVTELTVVNVDVVFVARAKVAVAL